MRGGKLTVKSWKLRIYISFTNTQFHISWMVKEPATAKGQFSYESTLHKQFADILEYDEILGDDLKI